MGNVSTATCLPAGARRQPLLSRKPPRANGPTRSGAAGWEEIKPALMTANSAARQTNNNGFTGCASLHVFLCDWKTPADAEGFRRHFQTGGRLLALVLI